MTDTQPEWELIKDLPFPDIDMPPIDEALVRSEWWVMYADGSIWRCPDTWAEPIKWERVDIGPVGYA